MSSRNDLWATGHDESVEVNQRALINKILARYSGEFTVFRELLQNSDDAEATAVEIHFETKAPLDGNSEDQGSVSISTWNKSNLPDLKTTNVQQWTFKNNGGLFQDVDWNRLKKIAEGNPDEDKIGAFGVGFYSVFSVTDEPFVKSGSQWMGFYWKNNKDQLFARRGHLSVDDAFSAWTSFDMVLRDPAPMPPAFDLTRFLLSSIVFMKYLSEVSVYFDNICLTKLTKSRGVVKTLGLSKGLYNMSPRKCMTVKQVSLNPLEIKAEVLRWVHSTWTEKPRLAAQQLTKAKERGFFSSLISAFTGSAKDQSLEPPLQVTLEKETDPLSVEVTSLALSVFSADVSVQLDQKLAQALHRSTLKDPPSKLKYDLVYTDKNEYDAARKEDEKFADRTMSIFHSLRADIEGLGYTRIFIGHATSQTTGLGGHMAARFIPTVERESIDLVDQNVAVWNRELLHVGGVLARSAYEYEMKNITSLWDNSIRGHEDVAGISEVQMWLLNRGLHALQFFTFHRSAPSEEVSAAFESSFFSCAPEFFPIVSTQGVQNAFRVRYPDPAVSAFIRNVPIIPDCIVKEAHPMLSTLRLRGMVKEIMFDDVIQELQSRPLSQTETLNCLQWWIKLYRTHANDQKTLAALRENLLDAAVLTYGSGSETLVNLRNIKTYVNPTSQIPLDGPLPSHLLPVELSKNLSSLDMSQCLLWTELTVVEWIKHICNPDILATNIEYNIDRSPHWAERVLSVLSRLWPALAHTTRGEVKASLAERTCVPTSHGMKIPSNAYFASADIFHDLPIITMPSGSIKSPFERFLESIGVQRHIDLQIVFNRMIKTNQWTIADLMKYLVSISATLTPEEMARLKATAAFPKEARDVNSESRPQRYQAKQLYEPLDIFRKMDLPIIDWGQQKKWRSTSKEAGLLFELGLRKHPPLDDLIGLCTHDKTEIRQTSFKYLLDNLDKIYKDFSVSNYDHVSFLPCLKDSKPYLGAPNQVFVEPEWAMMGFLVLDPLYSKDSPRLGIAMRPPLSRLVRFLENNRPCDKAQAQAWFSLLAGRINEITDEDRTGLSHMPMIPHYSKEGDGFPTSWLSPIQCYFNSQGQEKYLIQLFKFVDFGPAANSFLAACGAKREPTIEDIVQILLQDPYRFFAVVDGYVNFLAEMRRIALNYHQLSSEVVTQMKRIPCLLGFQRRHNDKLKPTEEDEEASWEAVYEFKIPEEIVIADDTQSLRAFSNVLFTAPQEDVLEAFYLNLGSRRLSSLVKEVFSKGQEVVGSPISTRIKNLMLERLPLFLYEYPPQQTKFSLQWLKSEGNFVVKTFRELHIIKTLASSSRHLSHKQDASAVACRSGAGPIHIWLSNVSEVDLYEVATAMNRLLFDRPKANDALLLTTILSTDLKLLKKRGFNVERILRHQEDEVKLRPHTPTMTPKSLSPSPLQPLPPELPRLDNSHPNKNREATKAENRAQSPFRRLIPSVSTRDSATKFESIVDQAIRACHPEADVNFDMLRNIRDHSKQNYQDACGPIDTLQYIGNVGKMRVYVARDVPHTHSFINNKRAAIERFTNVIATLCTLFGLSLSSLHIFFDLTSQRIAFNREGSLFLNLRFYEMWHDPDVVAGRTTDAYISWYFTLAHEIAHNVVQDHNAEHEFFFSATCQKFITPLCRLISHP
ncbi:hypothetical protein AMATHDRAFT_57645 [Amanita thiersii Skay4041]|uniref:Sacsin/Nov domain-containing protein n=1 Tax=Amanita thiersii Skay4041 TaxID=703135 RepID=A0A2A9NUL1_9AGAR|nr:hypothetical protein AMATHDRAFT_57645 [Amanita thiersii Skay4041]